MSLPTNILVSTTASPFWDNLAISALLALPVLLAFALLREQAWVYAPHSGLAPWLVDPIGPQFWLLVLLPTPTAGLLSALPLWLPQIRPPKAQLSLFWLVAMATIAAGLADKLIEAVATIA